VILEEPDDRDLADGTVFGTDSLKSWLSRNRFAVPFLSWKAFVPWCKLPPKEQTSMNDGILTSAKAPGNWTQLNKQLAQAKTLLRQISRTVADIEDARTIERAKRAHGNKPRIPWAQVKRELQLD
jgi:hypothetical protein